MGARREQSLLRLPFPGAEFAHRNLVEARDVVHVYGMGAGKRRALQGITLALKGGELTLLMGPSGSGKTTLLSILGCILSPSEGTVYLAGEAAMQMSREQLAVFRRNHIGYVFQSYNLFPTLTAEENVRIALDVRGLRGSDAIVASQRALQTVGLLHKAKSFPAKLSGGEQQRVAVARALVGAPAVILADEPTASLDSKNGMAVMELLKQLASKPSCAVLAVTHDPRTVPFADRILHIEDGQIINERHRPDGIPTVNDYLVARNRRMAALDGTLKFPTVNPERECHLAVIKAGLLKHAPDCEAPYTFSDVVKARFAQRRRVKDLPHAGTTREDMLAIAAEWDNPNDALASQSDACLAYLAEMFTE